MTKKEKFDIMVAAFEALLAKHKLWREYYTNFKQFNTDGDSAGAYTEWKKWAYDTHLYQWVASAFVWNETPQDQKIWRRFDYEWLKLICRNLNI